MESWRNSRREATEEFKKVLDRIESQLESELDPENNIVITRDRYRLLSDRSARTEEFEDNIKVLGRRNQALETRLKDTQLFQDKAAENEKLVHENRRLVKELERQENAVEHSEELKQENERLLVELNQFALRQEGLERTAARCVEIEQENDRLIAELGEQRSIAHDSVSRIGQLESELQCLTDDIDLIAGQQRDAEGQAKINDDLREENKRLSTELDVSIKRLRIMEAHVRGGNEVPLLKTAIGTNVTPSSGSSAVAGGSESAEARNYDALATKYNRVYSTLKDSNAARVELAKQIQILKGKRREWVAWSDSLEKDKAKLADKVERLEEQVQSLRKDAIHSSSTAVPTSSSRSLILRQPIELLEGIIRASRGTPHGSLHFNGEPVEVADFVRSLLLNLDSPSSKVDIPNSPVARPSPNNPRSPTHDISVRQGKLEPLPDQDLELPEQVWREGTQNSAVEDTQFELMELHHSSSTQDESNVASVLQNSGSLVNSDAASLDTSSSPIVVSSRIVGRKKNQGKLDQPVTVSRIKVEALSSSPTNVGGLLGLDENIDLDEIGEKQHTPRKKKSGLHVVSYLTTPASTTTPILSNDSGYHTTTYTPVNKAVLRRSGAALRPLSTNKLLLPRASDERPAKKRRIVTDLAIDELADDRENSQGFGLASENAYGSDFNNRVNSLLQGAQGIPKTALTTKSLVRPNKRNNGTTTATAFPSNIRSPDQIYELNPDEDDGSDDDLEIAERHTSLGAKMKQPPVKDKSRDMIHSSRSNSKASPASEHNETSQSQERLPAKRGRGKAVSNAEVASMDSPTPQQSHKQPANPVKATKKKRKTLAAKEIFSAEIDHPDNEPLRARPVGKLSLDDFIINKKYNQGFSYAYKDVVRGKAQRSCLQGCTKPECCGKQFELLAKLELDNQQPLTFSQKDANNALLSEFLGENGYKLRTMTKDERADVLLKAKTREVANKYGRHRHAYEERATPPGFWRIDFPNTQEGNEDREKARLLERTLVEQRYQDAMRSNGPYIFRDELEK